MSSEFLFPDVGEGIAEGKLVDWKVNVGDSVSEDQVVCEVETDKAVVEIPSPRSGTIASLNVSPGDTISVGSVLLTFSDGSSSSSVTVESNTPAPSLPVAAEKQTVNNQGPVVSSNKRVLASPSTRRLARSLGIDLSSVSGSGPSGRILASDVQALSEGSDVVSQPDAPVVSKQTDSVAKPSVDSQSEVSSVDVPKSSHIVSMSPSTPISSENVYSGRRKVIGEHMVSSQAVPSVTLFAKADATHLITLRNHLKTKAESLGVKLTYMGFFTKVFTAALRKFPYLNAHFVNDEIKQFSEVHVGIAVDNPHGLVVPVVFDAHAKSVLELASEIASLASRAQDNKLDSKVLSGSTATITSIGRSRVEFFTPMINTPEVCILGVGGMVEEVVVRNGDVEMVSRVPLSFSFDHRVVDGAYAAKFVDYFVSLLEDPDLLMLGGL